MTLGIFSWLTDQKALMAMLQANEWQALLLVAAVIFCETGLVLLPFLPGDSILFAAGAFIGLAGHSPWLPLGVMAMAAIAGDGANFAIGRSAVGRWLLGRKWISDAHLTQTKNYFQRYGASTITIGRFVPVVRTIAPFVAGMSGMNLRRFVTFNVAGGLLWSALMVLGGYWLGRIEWVSQHLSLLSVAIVAISLVPVGIQWFRARRQGLAKGAPGNAA